MAAFELSELIPFGADNALKVWSSWDTRLALLLLMAVLLLGALIIATVSRWRRSDRSLGLSASDQLAQFRTLYEQGAISEEEFRRLRSLLGGQIRDDLHLLPQMQLPDRESPSTSGGGTPRDEDGSEDPPETGIRPGDPA